MRPTLVAKPVDSLTATLKFSVSRSGGTPYGAHALNNIPSITNFSGNIDWFSNGAKYAVHKDIRDDSVSLKLDWALNEHYTLTSVTGFDFGRWYERSDDGGLGFADDGTPIRIDDPNTYFSTVNAFSQEVRLTSRDLGAFSWLAGLYYGRDSTHATLSYHFFDQSQGYGAFFLPDGTSLYGFDEYNNFDQIRDSRALFLNAGYAVTPQVTLRAGVRYTKDKLTIKNFYALEGGLAANPALAGSGPFDGDVYWTQTIPYFAPITYTNFSTSYAPQGGLTPDQNESNDNLSFKAGVDWKPSDDTLVYASFSQGYRGAAFNGQAMNAPGELTFASPEKLNSFEAGLKSDFWNRRAEFNMAVFHYDYRNQQFLDSFANPAGGTLFHTRNARQSRVDGAEFELRARISPDFELHGSIGLMDSKYIDLTLHGADRSGNKLIQAPPFNANLSADWRFAHLGSGDLKLNVNGNYYAKQYFDAQNTERIAQDSYGVVNARMSYEAAAKSGFSAGVWIKNITNRQYLADAIAQGPPSDGGLGFDYSLVGEPRTYGVDVTYRY
jgi:iron complex outermembrane receptor protein